MQVGRIWIELGFIRTVSEKKEEQVSSYLKDEYSYETL